MLEIIGIVCLLLAVPSVHPQEQAEHRNFQYNSAIDPLTGRYNFAYDTGNDNDIAHSMHMQYQDANGIVRGRYGYTDPRGKLRMVEYEAGPDGFIARGDVGPDQSPHDNAPLVTENKPLSSYQEGDFLLDPAPIQMAGWDPEGNPISQGQSNNDGGDGYTQEEDSVTVTPLKENMEESTLSPFDRSLFPALNITNSNPLTIYDSEGREYDDRYPRISYSLDQNSGAPEVESEALTENNVVGLEVSNDSGLNINNIDVNPEEIRTATGTGPVRRSADITSSSGSLQTQQTRSQPVKVTTSDGRRLFYRDSHSMEPHEHYYFSPTHDHDAETRYYRPRQTHNHYAERYYRPRQTHDHDAERRYYSYRQTHDHDAERRYYRARQTHDHDAEQRYYRARQTHDHDAERPYYYQRIYRNGRIYYRDRHSQVPHAHSSQAYVNHGDHQHSDVHLYSRYRNNDYPATAKPRQLQYIPSDKYHDKEYYWTYS